MRCFSLALGLDLIFELESGQTLVVEDFTDFALVEAEVTVGHMAESHNANEDQHPGVVAMAVALKRIVTDLVAVRLVMQVVFLLEIVRV